MGRRPAIVLAHGLVHPLGAARDAILLRSYFVGVPEYLRRLGYRVLDPRVSNMGHVQDRAAQLRERISAWRERDANERVVLIGHSMGGLDARWMLSQMNGDELVHTLVTVGSPHRGCCIADIVVDQLAPVTGVTERLHRAGMSLKAIDCLTTRYMRERFNETCADVPGVDYAFVAGCTDRVRSPLLKTSQRVVRDREGPNDGMVSMESARWGRHIGTFDVDHFEQVLFDRRGTAELYRAILRDVDPVGAAAAADAVRARARAEGAHAVKEQAVKVAVRAKEALVKGWQGLELDSLLLRKKRKKDAEDERRPPKRTLSPAQQHRHA